MERLSQVFKNVRLSQVILWGWDAKSDGTMRGSLLSSSFAPPTDRKVLEITVHLQF